MPHPNCSSDLDCCGAPSSCTRHAAHMLAASGGDAIALRAGLQTLADQLRPRRSGSARAELLACGAWLAERFDVDLSGDPAALRTDGVLARDVGAPLALVAVAVTAARDAGIALGVLAGPRGRLALAHALLARPLVLEVGDGFAPRELTGEEASWRWLCPHEAAQRVGRPIASSPRRAALPALALASAGSGG